MQICPRGILFWCGIFLSLSNRQCVLPRVVSKRPPIKEGGRRIFFPSKHFLFLFVQARVQLQNISWKAINHPPNQHVSQRPAQNIQSWPFKEKTAVCNIYFQIMFTQEWFPFKKWFFGFFYASFCACVCGKTWHSCPNLKISLIKQCISCGLSGRSLANLTDQVGQRQIRISK